MDWTIAAVAAHLLGQEWQQQQKLRVTPVHEGRELQAAPVTGQWRAATAEATPVAGVALCFAEGVVTRLLGSSKAPNVYPDWPSPPLSSLNRPTHLVFFSPALPCTM